MLEGEDRGIFRAESEEEFNISTPISLKDETDSGASRNVQSFNFDGHGRLQGFDSDDSRCESPRINTEIDSDREKYPFCLVWTPIPALTYILPFVGHLGIADSRGIIYDFAGPYTISVDDLSFGATTRYIQLFDKAEMNKPEKVETYDKAVRFASEEYSKRMHNLCCDNCHSHVALVLNTIRYRGSQRWNMVWLAAWLFFAGKFVSFCRFLQTVLPSIVLYGTVVVVIIVS